MLERARVSRARLYSLSALALLTVSLVRATPARAQEESRRQYRLLRDEERWAWLRARTADDVWDPLKYLPLSHLRDNLFLTVGGELREWVEAFRNERWGYTGHASNRSWLQRAELHGDLHLPRLRLFVMLESGLEAGRAGKLRASDRDAVDATQAFVDVDVVPGRIDDEPPLLLRIGRQEMSYGSGRFIDVREGANVRAGYDGVRLMARRPFMRVDAWLVRPVLLTPGAFDDRAAASTTFWGLWGTLDVTRWLLDVYYLGLDRGGSVYEEGTGHERRHTAGGRVVGRWAGGRVVADAEAAYQLGRFLQGPIAAWRLAGSVVGRADDLPLAPQLAIGGGATSGDRRQGDGALNTFSPLFARAAYFGLMGANGASNTLSSHATLTVAPAAAISLSLEGWMFWRQSLADGVYNVPGVLIVPGAGNPHRYVGFQLQALATVLAGRHWSFNAALARFWIGAFLEASPSARDISYAASWASYKF